MLCLTQDPDADALLSHQPLALLLGMLLDQQVPMERAFAGPKTLRDRLGGLEAAAIAHMDPPGFVSVCIGPPAVHRFPGAMAKRIQSLCGYLVEHYDGDPRAIWTRGAPDGVEVLARLRALPGFGEHKAKIFLALLGKQCGVQPAGWRAAAGDYGVAGAYRSVADVTGPESLAKVRAVKKQLKTAAKPTV